MRWWLFSAISSNLACWTTCSTQKLTANIEKITITPYWQRRQAGMTSPPVFNYEPFSLPGFRAIVRLPNLSSNSSPLCLRRSMAPGIRSTSQNARTPTTALPRAWPAQPPRTGSRNAADPAARRVPMNTIACSTVARKNTTNRGIGRATMKWVAIRPARKPTIVFAKPPIPMTPLERASCARPADGACQQAGDRTEAERRVPQRPRDPGRCATVPRMTNRASVV